MATQKKTETSIRDELATIEERLAKLEHPTSCTIDQRKVNGEYMTNPCGCLLPKDANVHKVVSPIQEGPEGSMLFLGLYQCLKCMKVIKIWQEVRVKREPLIQMPGVN